MDFYRYMRFLVFPALLLITISGVAQVSSYNFSQSTGTYTALSTGATTLYTTTDDAVSGNITIPFSFTYSGTAYTACKITTNGYLTLGTATTPSTTVYTPVSNTVSTAYDKAIAGLARNLNATVKYQTLGTSPNRIFVVEWSSAYRYAVGSSENINFQIRLYETSNLVEVQYGSISTGNTSFTTGTCEVGLKSASTVYNNVTFTNASLTGYPYTNNWNSLVNGAAQNDVVGITSTIFPASGSILRWTPSSCAQVTTAATVSSITSSSALVSWTNSGTYASGYRVRWRKVDETYTAATWATPVAVAAGSNSYTIAGLSPSTYYVFSVEGRCNASSANNYSTVTTANTTNGKGLFATACANLSLPVAQGFNATTFPACWTQQTVTGTSNIQFLASSSNPATTPQEGSHYVYWNSYSYSSGNQTRLVSPPITTTGSATVNVRFYWYHDNSAYTTSGYATEGVTLQYSLNGTTWNNVQVIPRLLTGTTGWTLYDITLPAPAGNAATMYTGFLFTSRLGNNCALDNVLIYAAAPCATPGSQPTSLNLSSISSTGLSGSFTAASPAPSGYLVLRSTSNTAPTLSNGTIYTTGNSYTLSGNSYTVVSNGTSTSFSETGISPNTQYYYYIFSYNSACSGAPFYRNTSPLTGNALTCTAAPATLTGAALGTGTASITFSTVSGAAQYILQYSVAGANSWTTASPAPGTSPYTLNGLNPGTSYDIRLQGPNSNCGTLTTTANAFSTACVSLALPVSQGFEAGTVIPVCWAQQLVSGTKSFSYGSNVTAAGTSPNPVASAGSNRLLFPSYTNSGNQTRLRSPVIITTGTSSVDVEFQWYFSTNGSSGSYLTEGVQVQWSTDGTNWNNAGSLIRRYGPADGWQKQTVTLPPGAGNQTVLYVGFLFTSNAGYDAYMDDVWVKATPVCTGAVGGTISSGNNAICGSSGTATFTATGYTTGFGQLLYQWQSSPVSDFSSGVTDIPGATNPATYTTGVLSTTTYYRLKVTCQANGQSGFSNILAVTVNTPQVLSASGATRCGIGTATLTANVSPGSNANWFATASGGGFFSSGSSFTTPEISSTTTYYVNASTPGSVSGNVGPASPAAHGGSTGTQTVNWRVYFDVLSPTTLQSVDIFPLTAGQSASLYVFNSAGTLLLSVPYTTSVSGGTTAQTIPINLALTAGTGYNLYASAIPSGGLARNESGSVYPYTSTHISITGNGYDDTYFMCYYNWKFSIGCQSSVTPVTVTVTPPPAIALSTDAATICSGSSTTVSVTAGTVGNFNAYSWSPATQIALSGTPSGSTATLSPTQSGSYTITGTTAGGCANKDTVNITVNPAPPVTTGAAVCSGVAATLTSTSNCSNFTNSGNTITGSWNAATDPIAIQPVIFLPNSTTCEFDPDGNTWNYTSTVFQVNISGTYTFQMTPNANYDGMGYIYTGPFVPGVCPGTGTWIVGDDDSGPSSLEPLMTASLVAGVQYTLITTCYSSSSGTNTDTYTWNISAPPGGQLTTVQPGTLQWYTVPVNGTPIGSGSPFNPVGVIGSGIASNTSVGSYTFYAACSNNPTCRTATGYVIGAAGQWIGASNNVWSNMVNWCGGVPTLSTDAVISMGAPNMPVIGTGTGTVRNLTVNNGASLTVNNATLQIAGSITATNSIQAAAGTIEMAGVTAQALSGGAFTGRNIRNLIASNSVNVSSAANDSLRITGVLSFGNVNSKTFNSGNNVILVSDANSTARVADITNNGANSGNSFSGTFVVQRYMPPHRSWRLMTAPITAGAQTINQAWQEGVGGTWSSNPYPGYGTHVTGGTARTTVQGFDQGPFNASIYGYSGTNWNYLPATTGEMVTSREGWMLFVRGSRAINLPLSNTGTVADVTILRPKGGLRFGTQSAITNAAGGFTVVGNPYACPLDFKKLTRSGVIGGVGGNAFYLWDPYLGGSNGVGAFVTLAWNGSSYDKTIVTGGGSSSLGTAGIIPSSAAIMVNLSPGGSIGIAEDDKDTTVYGNSFAFRPAGNHSSIRTTLYAYTTEGERALSDGTLVNLDEQSATELDAEDAIKINNFNENIAQYRQGKRIAIERRGLLALNDTLFYHTWNLRQRGYELEISPTRVSLPAGTELLLEDRYLNRKTRVTEDDTTRVQFTVTSDAGSSAADRFRLLLEPAAVVPVSFLHLQAVQQGADVQVSWTVGEELNLASYTVEHATDPTTFSGIGEVVATGGRLPYAFTHLQPAAGIHYYRIRSTDRSGAVQYSRVVKVIIRSSGSSVTVYPNPVKGSVFQISLHDEPAGRYEWQLFNSAGQEVFRGQLNHPGGRSVHSIKLPKKPAAGSYELVLHGKQRITVTVIVE